MNCKGDADTKIVSTALDLAEKYDKDVVVALDDTDIAVMLIFHWKESNGNNIFYQQRLDKAWYIKEFCKLIGLLREYVLFVHAFPGCDTTSTPFGKGKASVWNMLKKRGKLREISEIMNDPWVEQEQVGMANMNAFFIMYRGKSGNSLTKLRFIKILVFLQKLLRVFIFPNLAEVGKQKFIPVKIHNYGKQRQNENKQNKDSNLMFLYH